MVQGPWCLRAVVGIAAALLASACADHTTQVRTATYTGAVLSVGILRGTRLPNVPIGILIVEGPADLLSRLESCKPAKIRPDFLYFDATSTMAGYSLTLPILAGAFDANRPDVPTDLLSATNNSMPFGSCYSPRGKSFRIPAKYLPQAAVQKIRQGNAFVGVVLGSEAPTRYFGEGEFYVCIGHIEAKGRAKR